MLGKLMKYEFKALFQELGVLYMVWLALEVIIGVLSRGAWRIPDYVSNVVILAYVVASIAVVVMTFIVIVDRRFYKAFYGDAGYFTLSLPVKISTHIWSKVITTTIWVFLAGVLGLFALILGILAVSPGVEMFTGIDLINTIFTAINENKLLAGKVALMILELIILAIVAAARFVLKFLTCVNVGAQFNRFKAILMGVFFVLFSIVEAYVLVFIMGNLPVNAEVIGSDINYSFWGVGCLILVQAAEFAIYFLTSNYLMKKRFNLE